MRRIDKDSLHYIGQLYEGAKRWFDSNLKGADPNIRNEDRWTPGILAAQGGHMEILHFLIDNGADVNADDYHGQTALNWAAKHGTGTILQFLQKMERISTLLTGGEGRH